MVDQIPANVVPEALLTGGDGTTAEDRAWLEADLSDIADLERYEWGPGGPPPGNPVRYVPGIGLMVEE